MYARAGMAFLGSLLLVFSTVRITWQFVHWTVVSLTRQTPWLVEGDPRLKYRGEGVAAAAGAVLLFLAFILK